MIIKQNLLILFLLFVSLTSKAQSKESIIISSPNKVNEIVFKINKNGTPTYEVKHKGKTCINTSEIGFEFKNQLSLKERISILNSTTSSFEENWEMPWGEQRKVENKYNELKVELQEQNNTKRAFNIYFRAYDDGIAFRYEFLKQKETDSIIMLDENTQFQLTGDHTTWWIPGDWDSYEHLYKTTKISEIDAISLRNHGNLGQTYIPENAVNTPVTMRTEEGLYLSFHEANLTNYAGMTLKVDPKTFLLTSELVGTDRYKYKVKRSLPFQTPWRTIQIADKATDLISSNLIVNLNEPNKIDDISWFQPKKYMGIWWEMHIEKASWDYGMTMSKEGQWVDTGEAHGKHGATTKNTKKYIDFAAKNNISGVLVEGWNTGWERWIGFDDREGVFDFITPYPDYDLEGLVAYGKEKDVEIIMHHETSGAPRTYEKQLDTAYQLMNRLGIHAVKTGYVGELIPKGEYHHGQWMVNHYRKVVETGAKYKIAINAHEPIKATGIRRTYPNAIAREGLRGQEFNAWADDGGNPPEHLSIVAFTRMLAGPIDFTPGVFDLTLPTLDKGKINTTLAHQLALFVVIYSPIQMACDLPENYENQPAFQFIKDVGVDWEQTKVLDGEIGDYVLIAREEKNSGNWFVGGITDENNRELQVDFSFLPANTNYTAIIYKDSKDSHYRKNPTAIEINSFEVTNKDSRTIKVAPGGGFAISIKKK